MKTEHILVIRFSAMGDVAMTVPVVYSLAKQYPHVRITVLSRPFARPFFENLSPNVGFMEADLKGEYKGVKEKGRTYYEVYSLQRTEEVPEDYKEISFVCLRADGAYEAPSTVGIMCRAAKKKVKGLEDFHFHTLRHTYTSNLLSGGAKPKDVQELLGHSDVSTTMNIYAHSTREAKRTSARLLDKVVGGE